MSTPNKKIPLSHIEDLPIQEQQFVQITEGGNTGWGTKYRADNPNYYGNIGQNAIDLGYSQNNSTTIGATGTHSTVSGGLKNIASGDASTIPGGLDNFASGHFSTVSGGRNNTANSYGEWVGGLFGTIPTGQDGAAWVTTDRLFNIGNGITDDARSDAFTILKNGLATLPSVTNTLIDAEPTGKAVVTKEWVQANSGGTIYVELTKTQLDTAIANSELVPGTLYKITEVETWMKQGDTTKAIYLHAISDTELEKKGTGEFYVPKYNQGVTGYGIWSGELWQKTSGAMGTEPSYSVDDVVIWGGKHWNNLTGNYGTFIDHYELDGTNWKEIPVNDTDYNVRTNIIEYDYANDMIVYRKDDVGNEISTSYENWKYWENDLFNGDPLSDSNYNPIKVFQWGNEFDYDSFVGVGFNIVENSVFECVNQRGRINYNTLNNGHIHNNTLNNGAIYNNTLNNGFIHYNTLNNNGLIHNNTLNNGLIDSNTINNGSIHNNTLNEGFIKGNNLNNGFIDSNTLESSGNIYNNTLENNGVIRYNTLENNGVIRLGLSNPINNKQIQNLIITGDIGGLSGIDLSSATLVYEVYERIVFKDSTGTTKIRYFDGTGNLVVADLTD